jgi:hypothetical protein
MEDRLMAIYLLLTLDFKLQTFFLLLTSVRARQCLAPTYFLLKNLLPPAFKTSERTTSYLITRSPRN